MISKLGVKLVVASYSLCFFPDGAAVQILSLGLHQDPSKKGANGKTLHFFPLIRSLFLIEISDFLISLTTACCVGGG